MIKMSEKPQILAHIRDTDSSCHSKHAFTQCMMPSSWVEDTYVMQYFSRPGAPVDWRDACHRHDLMFAKDDRGLLALLMPEVGNGNIATVAGKADALTNPHIFVAGVFNGCGHKGCHQVS